MSIRFYQEGCRLDHSLGVSATPATLPIAAWRRTYHVWRERRRYRKELRRLLRVGEYMLEDIGLNVQEAEREAAKPFWRT